jgi:hypothetical protein
MNYNIQKKMKTTSYIKFSRYEGFPLESFERSLKQCEGVNNYEDYIYVSPTSNTVVVFYDVLILKFISFIKPHPRPYSFSYLPRFNFKFKFDGDKILYEDLINEDLGLKWFQCIKQNLEQSKLIEEYEDKLNLESKLSILIEECLLESL